MTPGRDEVVMPLGEHLEELRTRLLYVLAGLIPLLVVGFTIGKPVLRLVIAPVRAALLEANQPAELLATSPLEVFYAYLKVSFILAILAGSPWIMYQLWRFVAPGLYAGERRFVYIAAPLSFALTTLSTLFLYYALMPIILAFFIAFGTSLGADDPGRHGTTGPTHVITEQAQPSDDTTQQSEQWGGVQIVERDPEAVRIGQHWINTRDNQHRFCIGVNPDGSPRIVSSPLSEPGYVAQSYRVSEYVSLFLRLALAVAIAFQTPVVVLVLSWAGLLTPKGMGRFRKHAVMTCAVLGAVLTPADPVSMMLLAVPLYGLYELGLVLARLLPASRVRGKAASNSDMDPDPTDAEGP